jgi:hypothetical protein
MATGYNSIINYPLGVSYAETANLNNTVFSDNKFKIRSNGIQDPSVIKKAPIQFWS